MDEDSDTRTEKKKKTQPPPASSSPSPLLSAAASKKEEEEDAALEKVLEMCNGEIVPGVPNLQLYQYMLAYGHSSGSEGVCMDSLPRISCMQSRVYERCIRFATHNFSAASGNNGQSKFVPNEWIDTFCKMTMDVDVCIPRIQKLALVFAEALSVEKTSSPQKNAAMWSLSKELNNVSHMFDSACMQCYERRMVDLQSSLGPFQGMFPSRSLTVQAASAHVAPFNIPERCNAIRGKCQQDVTTWVKSLCKWIADLYESNCLFGLEDEDDNGKVKLPIYRLPTPKQMGMTQQEFRDWSSVVTSLARRRVSAIREQFEPGLVEEISRSSSSGSGEKIFFDARQLEKVLVGCWHQLALVNMEVVNVVLFYISYAIRNRGEPFVHKKISQLRQGKYGSSGMLEKLLPPSLLLQQQQRKKGEKRHFLLLDDGSGKNDEVTNYVSRLMGYNNNNNDDNNAPAFSVSPLISIRLIQFAHGAFRHLVCKKHREEENHVLHHLFLLDSHGIEGLRRVFRWTTRGVVAARKGFQIIDKHISLLITTDSSSSSSGASKEGIQFMVSTVCKQSFLEMLMRIIHFRSFGTGRRFFTDTVHLLLRAGGFELTKQLVQIATAASMHHEEGKEEEEERRVEECIADIVTSWHCIVTMTSAIFGESETSKSFENEILQVLFITPVYHFEVL